MLTDLICLAWIIIFAYKYYKLEEEIKTIRKHTMIMGHNLHYSFYLIHTPKEKRIGYDEFMKRFYEDSKGEEDEQI